MSSRTLQVGVAVAAALAVIVLFFIFNPFMSMQTNGGSTVNAGEGQSPAPLSVQDSVIGTGATAQAGDYITVNYTGKLANGSVFDSSVGKAPFAFTLGNGMVIPGWDQGLVGMKVGGKRTLIIPPSLGYGAQDYGPIPGNSTLTFDVELLSVTPAAH